MSPSVTAVIPHWYEERTPALRSAVDALRNGTIIPDEILIWDNTNRLGQTFTHSPVSIIASPKNIGPKARFLAALMAETDYVFFQDNDMVVETETIANLVSYAEAEGEGAIFTLEGRRADPSKPYRHWPKVYGHGLTGSVYVAISLGRGELVRRDRLPQILKYFPWEPTTMFDDLHFSWAVRQAAYWAVPQAAYPIIVVPSVKGVSDLRDLHTGVGLCTEPGYYERRDQVAQSLFGGGR